MRSVAGNPSQSAQHFRCVAPFLQRSTPPSDASVEPMKVQETGVSVCAITSGWGFQGPRGSHFGSSRVCFLFRGSRAQGQAEVTTEEAQEVSLRHWAAPVLPTVSDGGSCAQGPSSGKCLSPGPSPKVELGCLRPRPLSQHWHAGCRLRNGQSRWELSEPHMS